MKKIVSCQILLMLIVHGNAQCTSTVSTELFQFSEMEFNLKGNGKFFNANSFNMSAAGYEVPAGSGKHTIYMATPNLEAVSTNGNAFYMLKFLGPNACHTGSLIKIS